MYILYLEIDSLPKSLNKKLRSNRFKNHRENKSWDLMIEVLCQGRKPKIALSRASISIVRHSHRFLDYDGLVGSMKPVVDALVTAKVLKDDTWNITGKWNVDQRFRSKKEGPLLEVFIQAKPDEFDTSTQ